MSVALAVAILAVSAALTIVLILAIEPLLVRYVMATPNARSSHAIPTPQGGGIAVMLAVIVVCRIRAVACAWDCRSHRVAAGAGGRIRA